MVRWSPGDIPADKRERLGLDFEGLTNGLQCFKIKQRLPGQNKIIEKAKQAPEVYSSFKKEHTQIVADYIGLAGIEPVEALALTVIFCEKNRHRDPDNIMAGVKFILDGLVLAGIIKDDRWRHVWAVESRVVKAPASMVRVAIEAREPRDY